MSLNINGRMKVKTLKSDFKDEFGLAIRVYDGRSFADDNATLASIRKGDSKGGEFAPRKNTKVGNLEDKVMELFGLKTQVAGSDDSYLCDNEHTLTKALEVDENRMEKRSARTSNVKEAETETIEVTTVENSELTDEEKEWLDDLWSLDEAPESIRASKAFMLAAVKEDGDTLEYASDVMKRSKEVVLEAVENSGSALEYASDELKNDKEVVLEAIKNYGSVLEYVSDELKNDKEVAMEAVNNSGSALEYVSDELKNDKEVVAAAVKNYGKILEYASNSLKNDEEFMLELAKQDSSILLYISDAMKEENWVREILMTEFENADSVDEFLNMANKIKLILNDQQLLKSAIGNAIYTASEYTEYKNIAQTVGSNYGNIKDTDWAIEIMKKGAEDLDLIPIKFKLGVEQWDDSGSNILDELEDDHEYNVMLPEGFEMEEIPNEIQSSYLVLDDVYNQWNKSSHHNSLEFYVKELTYDGTVYSIDDEDLHDTFYDYKFSWSSIVPS